MINLLKKIATLVAVALAFTTATIAQAATTVISLGGVKAGITDAGIFDPTGAPSGSAVTPGLQFMGIEFVAIDNPASWYWLKSDIPALNAIANGGFSDPVPFVASSANPLGAITGPFGPSISVTSVMAGLTFLEIVSIPTADKLSVTVSLTNNTKEAMTGLKWGVGFDPDQGGSGMNTTFNKILGQNASAAVIAFLDGVGGVTLANDTTASAFSIKAFINTGESACCAPVDPSTALGTSQIAGDSFLGDDSISLAYDIGTLGAGLTATFGYSYIFAVPEPEIYAMMGIGLALMGFVARRRKGQDAAAYAAA